jgi:4-amino-4-deoxy-L-arabinose transferase-like glycosyltransferase
MKGPSQSRGGTARHSSRPPSGLPPTETASPSRTWPPEWGVLGVILALALALRLQGLWWGVPDWAISPTDPGAPHYFSYHPDEWSILQPAVEQMNRRGDLNPHFFHYGTLYIYGVAAGIALARRLGLVELTPGYTGFLYVLARLGAVFLGVLTVWLTYLLGCRCYGRWVGWGAALLLALWPLHVVHSHFAAVDVPVTFWIALSLLGAAHLLPAKAASGAAPSPPGWPWLLTAGGAAGLAASTKYNGGVVLLPVLAAIFLRGRQAPASLRPSASRGGIAVAVAGAAFLLGTPYALLDFPHFWAQVQDEIRHAHEARTLDFLGTAPGWLYYLRYGFPAGLGWMSTVAAGVGLGVASLRRERGDLLLLSWVFPFYLLVGAAQDHFIRYLIPLLPALAVLTARWLWEVGNHPGTGRRAMGAVISLGVVLSAGAKSWAYLHLFDPPEVQTEVARWFRQNVPPGTRVGLTERPWFFTPPLVPANGGSAPGARKIFDRDPESKRYRWVWLGFQAEVLAREKPEWVLLTDFEYGPRLRLKQPAALAFLEQLEQDYRLHLRVHRLPSLLGWTFDRGPVPHDWRYLNPEVRVYRRREATEER